MKAGTLNHVLTPLAAALIAGGWLSVVPLSAVALDVTWVGSGSSWVDSTNWNPGLPSTDDNILITLSGAAVSFDSLAGLTYGQMELGSATFNQAANDLKVVGLVAGRNSGENAVLNLTGGSFTVGAIAGGTQSGGVLLGRAGDATFNHVNGTANIASIAIAEQGGNATYSFIDGVLNTDRVYVGGFESFSGSALFQQVGGTHTNNKYVAIGRDSTREALYDMQGGALNSAAMDIGYVYDAGDPGGRGRFEQSGGTHTVANDLVLGRDSGASGVYNLFGSGSVLTVAGDEWVGKAGWGTFNQLAGIHKISGSLYVDMAIASKGVFNLHGGTLDVAGNTFVGNSAGASGDFNHDGGTHTVTGDLVLGIPAGATGSYTLDGTGSLTVYGSTVIGDSGTGTINKSGGIHNNSGSIVIANAAGSVGTYNLQGGALNATRIYVNGRGTGGDGTLLYSGGDLKADIENRGYVELSGPGIRTLDGNVFNDGIWKVSNTTAVYTGTFTNAHEYRSDPSVNTFFDLIITENGYLVGGPGDQFRIEGKLESASYQHQLWDTQNAQLIFTGSGGHDFYITGLDMGGSTAGYVHNFGWGDLEITNGSELFLIDSNDPGGALYVGTISGLDIVGNTVENIHGNGLNVYYAPWANPSLNGQTYLLADGGTLAPVPEPETWAMLLVGMSLVGWRLRGIDRERSPKIDI